MTVAYRPPSVVFFFVIGVWWGGGGLREEINQATNGGGLRSRKINRFLSRMGWDGMGWGEMVQILRRG